MGKHAAPTRSSVFTLKLWGIIGILAVVAITAGVTAYFVWPTSAAKRKIQPSARAYTKEELKNAYRKGEFKDLIPKLDAYLVDHKYDYEARSMLASALVITGNASRAVKEYQSLVDAKPDNADVLYQAGVAMGQLGRMKDAIEYLGRATKASPNVTLYHSELARLLAKDKQYDAALAEWQQVLSQTPADDRYRATVYAEMASIYVAKGQAGAAKEIVDSGLQIDPQNDYLKAISDQIAASQPAPAPAPSGTSRRR